MAKSSDFTLLPNLPALRRQLLCTFLREFRLSRSSAAGCTMPLSSKLTSRRLEFVMLVRVLAGYFFILWSVSYLPTPSAAYDAQAQGQSAKKGATHLWREPDAGDAKPTGELVTLAPKVQKEIGKGLEALRANKLREARRHLDTAYRLAPASADVNYVLGLYSSQSNNPDGAKSYWKKALELNPEHLNALLSLSELLLREKNSDEALPLLKRAAEVEQSSWRTHVLLSEALLLQGSYDQAIQHAERALDLGHGSAVTIEPVLATALAASGDTKRAISVLQAFLKDHPADTAAKREVENLQTSTFKAGDGSALTGSNELMTSALTAAVPSLPLFSNWLPPDVDDRVPSVEPDAACALDDVLQKAGKRIQELVSNVDRFTATESLKHQSINKWGLTSSSQTRTFDYLVSVQEVRPGYLNVDEYRSRHGVSGDDFPDGIATIGLPSLVLIFHPYNAGSFEMTCEGLAKWNGTFGWQVHFRQRNDKPNTIRSYRIGFHGPSYPVALKGRAWIAADSYQILGLETDLIAPVPEIRLATDRTIIQYGPVHFREDKVDMWLPQSAEVFYDWKGRRGHRRHSFSNYLLFSVGDKQRISAPKVEDEPTYNPAAKMTKPNL